MSIGVGGVVGGVAVGYVVMNDGVLDLHPVTGPVTSPSFWADKQMIKSFKRD